MGELTIHDRTFVIDAPLDALQIASILRVIGRVGVRSEKVAANLGKDLLSQVIPNEDAAPGEERNTTNTQGNFTSALFPFLAALQADDLLELMAALLHFDNEQEGVRWLRKHKPGLNHLVQAVTLNLEHIGPITEAITNFTQMIGGLNLAGMLMQGATETGAEAETG